MKITIEELITFCEAEELNHRVREKRADDASGYTRSKKKKNRTVVAIQEEIYGDIYKQITDIMRKHQKIEEIVKFGNANELGFEYVGEKITEVVEDGNKAV